MVAQDLITLLVTLLVTYSTSEYLYGAPRRGKLAALAALGVNSFTLLPGLSPGLSPVLEYKHKVPIVGVTFLGALYIDTVVYRRQLSRSGFFVALAHAAAQLVPLFPLFSLMIAFIFLEIGELMEHLLGMSDARISSWLNQPIYYGVLYGPFSYVYVRVKAYAKIGTALPV